VRISWCTATTARECGRRPGSAAGTEIFGFCPRGAAHDALQVLIDEAWQGRRWVVETDIANCFSAIPCDKLMQAVEERISDQSATSAVPAGACAW
jgi:hypothetical protein